MRLDKDLIVSTVALGGTVTLLGGTVTLLLGMLFMPQFFRNVKTQTTGCETYRGYRNGSEGERYLYFDEKTLEERGIEPPNYVLQGDPNGLERDQSYKLTIKEGFFDKELISAEKCTDSETLNTNKQYRGLESQTQGTK